DEIKNLEDELNTVLFVRGKRHLKLTESGKLLYRRAKEILSLTDKAEHEIISMSKGMNGTISIGLVEGSAPSIAAEWIASFIKLHPEVKFRIMDGNSDELIGKLRSGLISLAVITAPYDQTLLNGFNVGKERMVAFMSKEHPLSKIEGNEINLSDLKNENLIVPSRKAIIDMLYKWFKEVKSEPKIVCEMDNYLDVAALAGRNIGVSIFPQTASVGNTSIITKNIVNVMQEITSDGLSVATQSSRSFLSDFLCKIYSVNTLAPVIF
ncbi:MAG: LysR substrate-binding domain-containing protein, partial [Clostridia bacterium]|nr:LysR substrate-binding domain-containing protein [Clostridia bacterium]